MKMNKFKFLFELFIFPALLLTIFGSCENSDKENIGKPYDPGKPIVLESFSPETGGLATKVIISGSNLGNDPTAVKVYFNEKSAPVIGCDKGRMLVITPRQPGDNCSISVVIGQDSVVFPQKYHYNITTTVTTLVGQKGTTEFKEGSFAEAQLVNPSFLTVDNEKNIFLAHWDQAKNIAYNICLINQQDQTVVALSASGDGGNAANVPTTDISGEIIMFPGDSGDSFWLLDPQAQWAPRKRLIIHPSAEEVAQGMKDFTIDWKHGFAVCKLDSFIYTRGYNGQLVKFNPQTRIGQLVADDIMPNTDGYLQFDPVNVHMLYLSYPSRHCIYTYNILTGEHKLFAGSLSVSGWKDGDRKDALLNTPRQFIFDVNNDLVVADSGNHCIRKISTTTGMVTTLIGIGGKAGYQDGNPDDALFNNPRGIAIDNEYNIYVADFGNNCVRKLAIE